MCPALVQEEESQGQDPQSLLQQHLRYPQASWLCLALCWAARLPYIVLLIWAQRWKTLSCFWTHPARAQDTVGQTAALRESS